MKKILFLIFVTTFCFFQACSSDNVEKEDSEQKEVVKEDGPTIEDVEIYFDKRSILFTSKEEVEIANLTVDLNGYTGNADYIYDIIGDGDVKISVGESEIESGKFTIPISFYPIKNGVLNITYKIKGTNKTTDLTIVTNFLQSDK